MSLDATIWAWSQDLRPTQKLLLLSLADRAGENMTCHPSNKRLSADTGLDPKTVTKGLQQLQEKGLIRDTGERKGERMQVRVWELINVPVRESTPLFPAKDTKNGAFIEHRKRCTEPPNSNNLTENLKIAGEGIRGDIWRKWTAYYLELKPNTTLTTLKAHAAKLRYYDDKTQMLMVNQSIERGWASIYEISKPKQEPKPKGVIIDKSWHDEV